ncbi:MAG: hypothetical protein JO270_26455 [Acidobacteriaceae bacterium]|nr:hypothetical protein [Acidobacteriaceae bacterium]
MIATVRSIRAIKGVIAGGLFELEFACGRVEGLGDRVFRATPAFAAG